MFPGIMEFKVLEGETCLIQIFTEIESKVVIMVRTENPFPGILTPV